MKTINPNRPILISAVQYQARLDDGTMTMLDIADKADELGADGLEVRRDHWPTWEHDLPALRRRLDERTMLRTFATFTTLFDPPDKPDNAEWLRRDVLIARDLDAEFLRVFLGPVPDDTDEAGWRKASDILAFAAGHDVRVALENTSNTPGGSLREVARTIERLASDGLGNNFDTGNYVMHGQDVAEALGRLGPHVIGTHLKDMPKSTGIGMGESPFDDWFDRFAALPQRIVHVFEFGPGDDPDGRIGFSLDTLRKREGRY